MAAPDSRAEKQRISILLASSNAGKLREYRGLATGSAFALDLLPDFQTYPAFEESAPTFAEIGAGKALHYSRVTNALILADDSGLVVPALGGGPGVHSARYAGPNATGAENLQKLLHQMERLEGAERRARFVCVVAIAQRGRVRAVASDFADGLITKEIRGTAGFGYDPIFFSPETGSTFAEASQQEKNLHSHRGKAFRRALDLFFQ